MRYTTRGDRRERRRSLAALVAAFLVVLVASGHLGPRQDEAPLLVDLAPPGDPPPPPPVSTAAPEETQSTADRPSGGGTSVVLSEETPAPPELPEGTVVVSTEGSPAGAGTFGQPVDLATALGQESPVRPGGLVLLRGGVYEGTFVSTIYGTRDQPIDVRSFPGEHAVLDGGTHRDNTLTIEGADTRFIDLEFKKSDSARRTNDPEAADLSRSEGRGISVFGPRTKLYEVVVRDHSHGIGLWRPAVDAEVRGAIVFNNGWLGPDRGRGHGIYVQNLEGTKRISDSLIFRNFGYGIHAYGLNGHVDGITVEGVTSFDNGAPSGRRYANVFAGSINQKANRIALRSNVLYHSPPHSGRNLQLGLGADDNGTAQVADNLVIGGSPAFLASRFESLEVQNNLFYSERPAKESRLLADLRGPGALSGARPPGYSWHSNTYIDRPEPGSDDQVRSFHLNRKALTFRGWREATQIDSGSSYSGRAPSHTEIIVRPSGGRHAIITVLNWSEASSVRVDLASAGLPHGSDFEIRDAQDFDGPPVASGTWHGQAVEVPLDSSGVTQPYGDIPHAIDRTPIAFGAFVLRAL